MTSPLDKLSDLADKASNAEGLLDNGLLMDLDGNLVCRAKTIKALIDVVNAADDYFKFKKSNGIGYHIEQTDSYLQSRARLDDVLKEIE